MNNINISPLNGSNSLNLIHMHSSNVLNNIIRDSDLNGTIVVGSINVWNHFNTWVMLQDNKSNKWHQYHYNNQWYNDGYKDKSIPFNDVGVRVLIKYRE